MSKKNTRKIIIFFGIVFAFFLKATFVYALELHYPNIGSLSINDNSSLPELGKYFFNAGILIAATIAAFAILFGGVYYLFSWARGSFRDNAKDWIRSGILGFLIIVCSYLIAYTINPNLVFFKLDALTGTNPQDSPGQENSWDPNHAYYNEIPIGTLTENLLTRKIDCYGFDTKGDPIDGEQVRANGNNPHLPTYTNHDRADCLLQLNDGAQKKAQAIAELSNELMKLMDKCDCEACDVGPMCGAACKKPINTTGDCCPKMTDPQSGKEKSVKEFIEHGPITIGGEICQGGNLIPATTGKNGSYNACVGDCYFSKNGASCSAKNKNNPQANLNCIYSCISRCPGGENDGSILDPSTPSSAVDGDGGNCEYDTDCPSGFCIGGKCAKNCIYNQDCQKGYTCVNYKCVSGCSIPTDCNQGYFCDNGKCIKGCQNENDCTDGLHCVDNKCVVGCTKETCPKTKYCSNYKCIDGCDDDSKCNSGQFCDFNSHKCIDGCKTQEGCSQKETYCSNFKCVHGCMKDAQCNSGYHCNTVKNTCEKNKTSFENIKNIFNNLTDNIFTAAITSGDGPNSCYGGNFSSCMDFEKTMCQRTYCPFNNPNCDVSGCMSGASDNCSVRCGGGGTCYDNSYNNCVINRTKYCNYIFQHDPTNIPSCLAEEKEACRLNCGGGSSSSSAGNTCKADCLTKPDGVYAIDCDGTTTKCSSGTCHIDWATARDYVGTTNYDHRETIGAECVSDQENKTTCSSPKKDYSGLDEFRCPSPASKFSGCSGSEIASFVESTISVNNSPVTIIKQDKWSQLVLIQQLNYLQFKISQLKQDIKKDQDKLDQAKTELNKCNLAAVPYLDLFNNYQKTDANKKITTTTENYTDPFTNKKIDISKYCKGFNYDNSSCYKKCNDDCPDNSQEVMSCYSKATKCSSTDTNCMDQQEKYIEKCFNSRPCTRSSNNKIKKFSDCITNCQENPDSSKSQTSTNDSSDSDSDKTIKTNCEDYCKKQYLPCSAEYQICTSQCQDNSKCVLDNSKQCLFGTDASIFKDCADQAPDQGNAQYCIGSSYLCKNGSDEYAGYPDCVEPYSNSCSNQGYSGSFLYDKTSCEKCPYPSNTPAPNTFCSSQGSSIFSCQSLCPETTKCPSASSCPYCPCDQIDQSVNFLVPKTSESKNVGSECYKPAAMQISAYQIVGPQCNTYSFNDDPLTFYCENYWWENPERAGLNQTPLGASLNSITSEEIPVGQTIDDADNWATDITSANDFEKDIQALIKYITKAGQAKDNPIVKNYCMCNAQFEDRDLTCKTECTDSKPPICGGKSCQQVIDYLSDAWNSFKQLKIDFIGLYSDMIQEPRSDIMKELSYSRQSMVNCSVKESNFDSKTQMLNCTNAWRQQIPNIISGTAYFPITSKKTVFDEPPDESKQATISVKKTTITKKQNHYCYGTDFGNLYNSSLTDNWFCATQQKTNQ